MSLNRVQSTSNPNIALISVYTTLGLQYLRLGYSGKAGLSLGKAQAYLKKAEEDVTTATQLEWHLAYTEYLVGIGNLDKGLQYFDAANSIASKDDEFNSAKVSGARIAKRVFVNRVIADAAYVTSLIAFEKGNANESLLHARRCVRLNTRAWAGLENLSKDSIAQRSRAAELTENLQALSLSGPREHSTTHDALNSPKLWPLVSSLHLGYIQAANIYRHLGMIRESIYFAEQALKTVEAVDAKPAINRTKVMLGDLKIRCGQMEEGKELLMSVSSSMGTDKTAVLFQVAVGNFERLNGNFAAEIDAYQRAEKTIDSLVAKTLGKTAGAGEIQTELVEQ